MRIPRPLLVLAAAAVAAGLAFWLLRTPGGGGTETAEVSPDETPAAGPSPAVSPGETPAPAALAAGRGAAAGALVIPSLPGSPAPRATLTVLREGRAVASAEAAAGLFRLEYPREAGDPAPFTLRAEAPRRAAVLVPLPARETDAGEIRLLSGLVYGGRLVDSGGAPVAGVVVDFTAYQAALASGAPSGADGSFLVPLPAGANLQGLFGSPQAGWGGPPVLEPKARGRLFLPVEARPEGLAGAHEVVLEERPVSIRLRFLDEATGQPAAGAEASLWSGQEFGFTLPNLEPFDAGTADAEGVFAPLWPLQPQWALVRVSWGGRVLWTLLDRADAEGKEPRDLVLPKEPLVLTVRCVEDASGAPVPGARVVLGTNAGMPLSGTTDAAGEIRWALFPSESFDPEPLEIAGFGAAWRDGAGNPRRAMDVGFRGPPQAEEGPSPVYDAPLVLRLGRGADQGIWVRVEGPPGAEPFRPQVLRACERPEKGYFLFAGQPAGPVADAEGRPVWWFWEWMSTQGADGLMPKEGAFPVELTGAGRDPLVLRADRAAVLAARRVEGALVFTAPAVDAMTRSLLVVGPDGRPVAGVLVAVVAGGDGTMISYDVKERERAATGSDGRATLHRLDPAGDCRVAAWDPATGNSGLMRGLDVSAPPERWRLTLEPPREFRVRVRFGGGAAMANAMATLAPLSAAFPMIPAAAAKDGELAMPSVPVAVCTAWIGGFGPRGEYRWVQGPAAGFEGRDVVLEKR